MLLLRYLGMASLWALVTVGAVVGIVLHPFVIGYRVAAEFLDRTYDEMGRR